MKNIVILCIAVSTFIVAQDTTASVDQEPQLPGLGVYIGGAFGGATSVDELPDGTYGTGTDTNPKGEASALNYIRDRIIHYYPD